jgi:hypothetical protein
MKLRYDVRPVYTALPGLDLTYLPQLYLDRQKSWRDENFHSFITVGSIPKLACFIVMQNFLTRVKQAA